MARWRNIQLSHSRLVSLALASWTISGCALVINVATSDGTNPDPLPAEAALEPTTNHFAASSTPSTWGFEDPYRRRLCSNSAGAIALDSRYLLVGGGQSFLASGNSNLEYYEVIDTQNLTERKVFSGSSQKQPPKMYKLPNGLVAAIGAPSATTSLINVDTETVTAGAVPPSALYSGKTVQLHNTDKDVFVVYYESSTVTASAIYRLASDTYEPTAPLPTARGFSFGLEILGNGTPIVIGGYESNAASAKTELYDLDNDSYTSGPTLVAARNGPITLALQDGRVLVTGGGSSTIEVISANGSATTALGTITRQRTGFVVAQASATKVLIIGGYQNNTGAGISEIDVLDLDSGTVSDSGMSLNTKRMSPIIQKMGTQIYVIDGQSAVDNTTVWQPTCSFEVIDFTNQRVLGAPVGTKVPRLRHSATKLDTGDVLIIGGNGNAYDWTAVDTNTALVYNHKTNLISATIAMPLTTAYNRTNRLPDGKILVTGVTTSRYNVNRRESLIFDPDDNTFTTGPNLTIPRIAHATTTLLDGRVLLTGGITANLSATNTTEIFDPSDNTFTAGPNMNMARSDHSQTLLSDGRVLIFSNTSNYNVFDPSDDSIITLTTAPTSTIRQAVGLPGTSPVRALIFLASGTEILNVTASTKSAGPNITHHNAASFVKTQDNRALLIGGSPAFMSYSKNVIEIDLTNLSFTNTAILDRARAYASATELDNGQVLFFGGEDFFNLLNTWGLWTPFGAPIPVKITSNTSFTTGVSSDTAASFVLDPASPEHKGWVFALSGQPFQAWVRNASNAITASLDFFISP